MNETGTRAGTSSPAMNFSRIVRHKDVSIVLLTAVLITIFSILNGQFLSQENLFVILKTMPELGLIAIGMTMLIIAGEFDLSVGSTFALSPFIMAYLTEKSGVNPILAFLVGISSGVAIGFLNGIITTKIGIPSFITTLGTMMAFRGVILLASAGFPEAYDRQQPVARFFTADFSGFPVQVIWFVAAAIVIWVILENHKFGNWTYV
ncbi:MAG: ABC transporter permease, partial [Spirochaetes bacterium]|nr:ABC transporter permease [Spirochaetota bacterium]